MAQPPQKKKIEVEDIPGAPEWLSRVVDPLNAFIEATYNALNKGVTFPQQFAGEVKLVSFTCPREWTPITYTSPWSNFGGAREASRWRKLQNGDVQVQLAAVRTGAPSGLEVMASGLPPADATYSFPCATSSGFGSLDIGTPGQLVYTSGGSSIFVANAIYTSRDRQPGRWPNAITVRLGSPGKPFPGRPGQVLVLGCRRGNQAATPIMVYGLDWSADVIDGETVLHIHKVWGIQELLTYNLTLMVMPE